MQVDQVKLTTLAVASDAGPIIGLGLVFQNDSEARVFADAASRYFQATSPMEKTFKLAFRDLGVECNAKLDIIAGDEHTWIDFEKANRKILTDLLTALDQQPYFFVILCTADEGGVYPLLTDELVMYRAQLDVDGRILNGQRGGRWPSSGTVEF